MKSACKRRAIVPERLPSAKMNASHTTGPFGSLQADGYSILRQIFAAEEIRAILEAIARIKNSESIRTRGQIYAIRNLLSLAGPIRELASARSLRTILEDEFTKVFPVRATLFDKVEGANWLVPWHQDLTICVRERIDVPGYGPWSIKAGICRLFRFLSGWSRCVSIWTIAAIPTVRCEYCPGRTTWVV